MDRLTKKERIKLSGGEEVVICNHNDSYCNDSCMKIHSCNWLKIAQEKLWNYENADENGLLKKFPCGIGADIYYIPSKVNFDLNVLNHHEENNKVYHQNVASITYTRNGWYLECDKDIEYSTDGIFLDKMFGETWFLTEKDAENALAKLSK